MKILILTGKFGMGHWSASMSLRQQLLRAFPDAQAEVLDLIAYTKPNTSEAMYRWFNLLVTRGSGLFNLYYKITQDLPSTDWQLFEEQEIICVTGIPVRLEFKHPARRRGGEERRLLVMGGGLGLMPRKDSFYEELNDLPNVHTTIITGGNQKLYERLAGKYPNIEVLGFTDRVYEYMAASDLVLTKPGGITMFESIFSELPILAWEPFLEQEKNNARFLLRKGMGRVAAKEPEACLAAIRNLIYDDEALAAMSARMQAMKARLEEEGLNRILSGLALEREAKVG